MPAGRPSSYNDVTVVEICSRLAAGEPLCKICRDEHMPDLTTVYRWLRAHEEFRQLYSCARDDQSDTMMDEIVDIADEPVMGEKKTIKANGDIEIVQGDMIEHRKLRVDARKFASVKLRPKKYGELVKHEHGGADGAPIPVSITVRYERPTDS